MAWTNEQRRKYARKYRARPGVQARINKYQREWHKNRTPEQKRIANEYQKEYNTRPEVKARKREYHREYSRRPDVRAKIRAWQNSPAGKAYKKEYSKRPEARAKQRIYTRRAVEKRGTRNAHKWISEKTSTPPADPHSLFHSKKVLDALMFDGVNLDNMEKRVRGKVTK